MYFLFKSLLVSSSWVPIFLDFDIWVLVRNQVEYHESDDLHSMFVGFADFVADERGVVGDHRWVNSAPGVAKRVSL